MAGPPIDRDKLRAAIRTLADECVFDMLDEAIDLLPQPELLKLVNCYLDPSNLQSDGKSEGVLLSDVKAFEEASLAGAYYECFNPTSKNYTQTSNGTRAWVAACNRLLDRCVTQASKGNPAEVRQAFDALFGSLDHLDDGLDDVVFFADKVGSWQVGVDWGTVLPPWFKVLAATATQEECAERITALLTHRNTYAGDMMLDLARRIATPDQRQTLAEVAGRSAGRQQGGTKA